ncbi:MAG: T9SS type A sorting domain-containing protein [Candidatus Cloacimonetes bacterium]|nr:T9SS type A sorting domain-containing protein [Candidatus Cloacimonadota bacterium]
MHNTQDGNIILAGRSDYNAALRKITEDGTTIWTKVIDCGTSIAYSVDECSNGDYVLTGVDYDNYNVLVVKTDSLGDSLWTRTFNGLGGHDMGRCIRETHDGNIIMGGRIDESKSDYMNGAFIGLINTLGDTLWTKTYAQNILYIVLSLVEVDDGYVLQGGKLVKINSISSLLWNEPLTGDVYGGGDKNLQRTPEGGFLCVATEDWGDRIVLNKTDSLGQVYSIDDPNNQQNIISINIYPNPIKDYCTISFNNHNFSLKDPQITIYNIKGQVVRELGFRDLDLGFSVEWDGRDIHGKEIGAGVYFVRMKDDTYQAVSKVIKLE